MIYRYISTITAMAMLLLLISCPGNDAGGDAAGAARKSPTGNAYDDSLANISQKKEYYPHFMDRPYTGIHPDAEQAWYLVETSYLVIKDKYDKAQALKDSEDATERAEGEALYAEVVEEVNTKIFGTNPTVEQLFKSAIEAQPDNPLNLATYAVYLKPRKRYSSGEQYENTEEEAVELLDQAIEIWPDDPRFYYMKIYTLTEPHQAHTWSRSLGMEIDAIRMRVKDVSDIYDKLEEIDPENSFVNYSRALFLAKIYVPEFGDEPIREIIRELRKGNDKEWGKFYYPPPLPPFNYDAKQPKLFASNAEPVYIDQWFHYGNLDPFAVGQLVRITDGSLTWPADKKDIGEVMYMLYALGRLEPFDRSYFNLQLKCLHRQQDAQAPGSEEKAKLAAATRFLNDQYLSVSKRIYKDGLIEDETRLGVLAIEDMERGPQSGKKFMHKYMQGPQAAYLKRAGEILDLDFPLPDDPEKW